MSVMVLIDRLMGKYLCPETYFASWPECRMQDYSHLSGLHRELTEIQPERPPVPHSVNTQTYHLPFLCSIMHCAYKEVIKVC